MIESPLDGVARARTAPASRALPFVVLLSLSLGVFVSPADAKIYRYVDRAGDTHYSDSVSSIPVEYRDQIRDITEEMDQLTGFRVVSGLNGDAPDASAAAAAAEDGGSAIDLLGSLPSGELAEQLKGAMGFGFLMLVLLCIPLLLVISASILKLACRISGEAPPGLGRACAIVFAQGIAGMAVGAATSGIGLALGLDGSASVGMSFAMRGGSMLASWLVSAAILASMASYGFGKSLWIGILYGVLSFVLILGPIAAVAAVVWLGA